MATDVRYAPDSDRRRGKQRRPRSANLSGVEDHQPGAN
jgi:hypothetical protein